MRTIKDVKYVDDYILKIVFDNRRVKRVDLKTRIERLSSNGSRIFKSLKRKDYFRRVRVNPEIGTICWPNSADFCPDVLYQIGK